MKAAQNRPKNYANQRRKPLEFEVGDQVLLRVSPTKDITRFGVMGKLTPRYIGLYPITQRVKEVTYHFELPPELPRVYSIFHVSTFRKYIPNPSYVFTPDPIQ